MKDLPRVAIISSLSGGLGHYCAHLRDPLHKYVMPKFITYPQIDLSGTVVRQITDSFVSHYIKWPRFDLDESNPNSIVDIYDYLEKRDIKLVNIHVATTVKKKIEYFTTFVLYGKYYKKVKFIFTLHDVLPFEDDRRLVKLLKMFYSIADGFTVGNEEEKEKLIKYFDIPASKIYVIHHGIYNLFNKNHYTREKAKHHLNIDPSKKVILFFGWMRNYKGFDYLIDAVNELSKKRNDFVVYVASGIKYASDEEIQNSMEKIKDLGLEDKFHLNLNYLSTGDIEAVFKSSDLVVLPYTHASQSGVLMTAAGFKKPVIITDVFSDRTWVKNQSGYVIKPKDSKALMEKIESLLDDPDTRKKFGEYGFEYASSHFDWKTIAREYSEVYKKFKQ